MADDAEILIPANMESDDPTSLRSYFQTCVDDRQFRFPEALDCSCDLRAKHAILETVTIRDVILADELIRIHYEVELSEFQACQDLHARHHYQRTVHGTRLGSVWRFEKFVPLPERSTCDEL